MFYEPHDRDKTLLPHDPFKALIAPRPIGWVSTMSTAGKVNLAPYSFFNAVGGAPPLLAFSSDGEKDSVTFAREGGEFVWNLATYDLREAMNETSAPLPRGESEFAFSGLTPAPSRLVRPPRVRESPANLECVVTEIHQLRDRHGKELPQFLVVGEVVGVHLDEAFIKDGIVEMTRIRPLSRCGYLDYTTLDSVFQMRRPKGGGNDAAGG